MSATKHLLSPPSLDPLPPLAGGEGRVRGAELRVCGAAHLTLPRFGAGPSLSPLKQGCPGKSGSESISRRGMHRKTVVFRLPLGLQDSERGRGMRFTPSIFGKLLEPIKRRQFDRL